MLVTSISCSLSLSGNEPLRNQSCGLSGTLSLPQVSRVCFGFVWLGGKRSDPNEAQNSVGWFLL